MPSFVIEGGRPLEGEISLAGSKNLASKLLIASLLTDEPCTLQNVPNIGENHLAEQLVSLAGARVTREGTTLTVHTPTITTTELLAAPRNRLPVLVIAPLLFRAGTVTVPEPGGDRIGARPINFHLDLLSSLGARVSPVEGGYRVEADQLSGTRLELPYPSVGATETALLATVWAAGVSTISNAALEPEVMELVRYLRSLGASIEQQGDREFLVTGRQTFHGATQRVLPDRIEAASYAALALASAGDVIVREARLAQLDTFLSFVSDIDGGYEIIGDDIRFWKKGPLRATDVTTGVHPGFMTDWQQPSAIALLTANGKSTIHETVHEQRFGYVEQLRKMGAKIDIEFVEGSAADRHIIHERTQRAIIHGPAELHGAELTMPDLRAGMAYVIAALIASGTSTLYGIEQVDRGYEQLELKLRPLGAQIERRA